MLNSVRTKKKGCECFFSKVFLPVKFYFRIDIGLRWPYEKKHKQTKTQGKLREDHTLRWLITCDKTQHENPKQLSKKWWKEHEIM